MVRGKRRQSIKKVCKAAKKAVVEGPESPRDGCVHGIRKRPVEPGCEWFEQMCGNTEAHDLLVEIEGILARGRVASRRIEESICKKAQRLTDEARWPECPLLCARAIHIMKRLAFLPGAENLCGTIFGVLQDIWSAGLRGEGLLGKQGGYKRVLIPQKALNGWIEDLPLVQPDALPSFLRLLRFERLHAETTHFGRAIEVFVSQIEKLGSIHAGVAVKAAGVFVSEIIESLLTVSKDQIIAHVVDATKLIAAAVRLDVKEALQKDTGPVRRAMTKLPNLLQRAGVPQESKNRPAAVSGHLGAAYDVLNRLHREREDARHYLQGPLSDLMPWLGGWTTRPARRNGAGWTALVRLPPDGGGLGLSGSVVDFSTHGGVHIKLEERVKDCKGDPSGPIQIDLREGPAPLWVKTVTLLLTSPRDGRTWECPAQAWRGWMYEEGFKKTGTIAGAVFRIDKMPDDLQERVNGLPERSGLEPVARHSPAQEIPAAGAVAEIAPGDVTGAKDALSTLLPCVSQAVSQYLAGKHECEGKKPGQPTDREVYNWLASRREDETKEHLPDFNTWTRYVRQGRRALGLQKNLPRTGREHGTSVVSALDVEPSGPEQAD